MKNIIVSDFEEWRKAARYCCLNEILPQEITWHNQEVQQSLFCDDFIPKPHEGQLKVPAAFMDLAKTVSYHSDPQRWAKLYQALWRMIHRERHLLSLATDPLVSDLYHMRKAVSRDAHKAKAFIRFKKYSRDKIDVYVAWHEPDHLVLNIIGPFFSRRYSDMIWSVFTPKESMHWDLKHLSFGPGSTQELVERQDYMDELWKDYYRATFNPARIKIKAMKREMPVRYWKNLPEAQTIASLLNEAPTRVEKMLSTSEGWHKSATDFIPATYDLQELTEESKKCQGCPLYVTGTQTVFGEGAKNAEIMIISDQPSELEDKLGQPLVDSSRAGSVLNQALNAAGVNRKDIYITLAVKHAEFNIIDGRKQNIMPNLRKIIDCNAWLQAEINVINPKVIITLGVVAGRALFGSAFKLKDCLGKTLMLNNKIIISTDHPSSLNVDQAASDLDSIANLVNALKLAKNISLEQTTI